MIETRMEDESVLVRVQALRGGFGDQMREIANEAARIAEATMRSLVPRGANRGPEGTIAESIAISGDAVYHPGGFGGGGVYEVHVGPISNPPSHLEYVTKGTGIFGDTGNLIQSHGGGPLLFAKRGEGEIFREWARGQEPQTVWLDEAREAAREFVNVAIFGMEVRD